MAQPDLNQKNVIPDEVRLKLQEHVGKNWDEIIQALHDLSIGVWVERVITDKLGNPVSVRVYQKEPDSATAQYLINQVAGKPKESMNVEGKVNLVMDE